MLGLLNEILLTLRRNRFSFRDISHRVIFPRRTHAFLADERLFPFLYFIPGMIHTQRKD